jgi:kynurenine formamidase
MLSDIFPTGYHGCVSAGVTTGSTVYIAGAGPVGLAAAHAAQLLGAGVVIVEGLDLLDVPVGQYDLICLPLKLPADGCPVRALLIGRTPEARQP